MAGRRGFSLIELVVVIALIAVFGGVLLDRMIYYQELVEKASMEQVAADLRSSVNLRTAELALENRFADVDALALQNPFDLLVRKPQNYRGVLDAPPAASVPPGGWYFDNRSKEAVYCVDLGRYFAPDERGMKCAAWRITTVPGEKPKVSQWARLELVRPYRWF